MFFARCSNSFLFALGIGSYKLFERILNIIRPEDKDAFWFDHAVSKILHIQIVSSCLRRKKLEGSKVGIEPGSGQEIKSIALRKSIHVFDDIRGKIFAVFLPGSFEKVDIKINRDNYD